MEWTTFLTSLCSAITVAFAAPRFQHLIWSRQRLREQRISVAERFAAMNSNVRLTTNLSPRLPSADQEHNASQFLEQDALLILIQVLFDREDTLASGNRLRAWLNSQPPQLSVESFSTLWMLRVDLLGRLFAEAFQVSSKRLSKRAFPKSANRPGTQI
jgi:hypothetical protein